MKIELTEQNLKAATEILEMITGAEGARIPHNPCITFEREENRLRFTSALFPLNKTETILVGEFSIDSLGDGWEMGDETLLINFLNENCDFSTEAAE